MSLRERAYGQGFGLVCDGIGCMRKFHPRSPRPKDETAVRQRAFLYGWRFEKAGTVTRDFCPGCPAGTVAK